MQPAEPVGRPSPWLAPPFLLSIVVVLVTSGTLWGNASAQQNSAERARTEDRVQLQACTAAVTALQVRVATIESEAAGTRRVLDTELAGLRREMERVAKAVERLADSERPRTTRR
jgi:hypothetical protein